MSTYVVETLIKFMLSSGVMTLFYYLVFRGKASFVKSRVFLMLIPVICAVFSIIKIDVRGVDGQLFVSDLIESVVGKERETHQEEYQTVPLSLRNGSRIDLVDVFEPREDEQKVSGTELYADVAMPPIIEDQTGVVNDVLSPVYTVSKSATHIPLMLIAYILGVVMCSTMLVSQVSWVRRIRKNAMMEQNCSDRIYRSVLIRSSFSFMKDIFIPDDCEGEKYNIIVAHEKKHIQHDHYIDLMIMGCYLILFWFNPFVWILKREIGVLHEFEVDDSLIKEGHCSKCTYMKVLIEESTDSVPILTNGFKSSLLKKRFIKMEKGHKIRLKKIRSLLTVPFIALLFAAFAFTSPVEKKDIIEDDIVEDMDAAMDVVLRSEIVEEMAEPAESEIPVEKALEEPAVEALEVEEDIVPELVQEDDVILVIDANESLNNEHISLMQMEQEEIIEVQVMPEPSVVIAVDYNVYDDPLSGAPTHDPDGRELPDDIRDIIKRFDAILLSSTDMADMLLYDAYGNNKIISIEATNKETRVNISESIICNWGWCFWDKNTCLIDKATGDKYMIRDIKGRPEVGRLYIVPYGMKGKSFETTLIFPPLKKGVTTVDFFEPSNYSDVPGPGNGSGMTIKNVNIKNYGLGKVKKGEIIR